MCYTPILLPNGQTVACRNCKQCRDAYIKDWVGRCIAESKSSNGTYSVTLTYGPDDSGNKKHPRTAVLTYSDVQLYLKRLRTAGFPLRYLIAGEYGSQRGRTHWHGILFFQDQVPPHELDKRFNDDFWPLGFQFWQKPSHRAVKYVCKYIQKDKADKNAQSKFAMSKMPALGGHYFDTLAAKYVADGLAPRGPFYRFPDEARQRNGKPIEFYMSGVTADNFREAYVAEWLRERPGQHIPTSEFVEEWLDKNTPEWRITTERLERLEKEAKLREAMDRSKAKAAYREWHDRYYFGAHRAGFYDPEWIPDGEEEEGTDGEASEYIRALYEKIWPGTG